MSWRARSTVLPVALIVAAGGLAACSGSDGPSAQQKAATAFTAALGRHDAGAAAALTDDPTAAVAAITADLDGLGTSAVGTLKVGTVTTKGDAATATFAADWAVPGAPHWTYDGSFPLARTGGKWQVHWQVTDVHPKLTGTTHLAVRHTAATRGALLDSAGRALIVPTPVVSVGIEKKLVTDLPSLASTLAAIPQLQSTKAEIVAAVQKAQPTDFVPVITLRQQVYETIKAKIHDLDGTVFRTTTELLGPTPHFGQPLLGRVTDATKEIVDASKGRIAAGDQTGVGGLEQALDTTLAGSPGVSVVAASSTGGPDTPLATLTAPRAGTPVRLTLDRSAQTAAESAVDGLAKPASIVAVSRSTGRILADANNELTTYDYGLAGAFPPGSTFKIATWTAVFTARPALDGGTKVACPGTLTVDGRTFVNENRFSHPPIPISAAFGYSCNTSAMTQALTLPDTALGTAARALGLGARWTLPVSAFSGSIPAPAGQTEKAADAIGQGRVLASPLLLALMAGAVTTGTPYAPVLTLGAQQAPLPTLPAAVVSKMAALMKATVDLPGGTGHALATIGDVQGKTGTAEYGDATPPRTHSWFAGVHGDVAFAVFVYDGATDNAQPAVPVAKKFLTALR